MPELPEVEITRRSLLPLMVGRKVERVVIRERRLRWPISPSLPKALEGQIVQGIDRRAKYLLIRAASGTALLHLGMSGSFSQVDRSAPVEAHEHFDLCLSDGPVIRYRDPRRFGAFLWTSRPVEQHRLLSKLGVEPLPVVAKDRATGGEATGAELGVSGDYLYERSRGRTAPLRNFLLDGRIVVGVGNIYASEACFLAGIRPDRAAGRVSRARYARLAEEIRAVLTAAIAAGGTTLRDFHADGQEGGFQLQLRAYGREAQPCLRCDGMIQRRVASQRSMFFCAGCQA